MYTKNRIRKKIQSIYPDIENCNIDLDVDFDRINEFWVVSLKKGNYELSTFIDLKDASNCIRDDQCDDLNIQVSQLRNNINKIKYC